MTGILPGRDLRRVQHLWTQLRLRLSLSWRCLTGLETTLGRGSLRFSYAQNGEDLIAWRALVDLGIQQPCYLDVGAHHPTHLNNTALFHLLGAHGMNIEPDPELHREFVRARPGDINLNSGVGSEAGVQKLYIMAHRALNTFSAKEAHRVATEEMIPIVRAINVPVAPLNAILDRNSFQPDFLTIDTEGNDLPILKTLDWTRYRPAVICAETLTFSSRMAGRKNEAITDFLQTQGYAVHADTWINTLYVDERRRA